MPQDAATVQPVVGRDGRLLAVKVNGVMCIRSDNVDWTSFAESILCRIATMPRDTESAVARQLIERDNERLAELARPLDP